MDSDLYIDLLVPTIEGDTSPVTVRFYYRTTLSVAKNVSVRNITFYHAAFTDDIETDIWDNLAPGIKMDIQTVISEYHHKHWDQKSAANYLH